MQSEGAKTVVRWVPDRFVEVALPADGAAVVSNGVQATSLELTELVVLESIRDRGRVSTQELSALAPSYWSIVCRLGSLGLVSIEDA